MTRTSKKTSQLPKDFASKFPSCLDLLADFDSREILQTPHNHKILSLRRNRNYYFSWVDCIISSNHLINILFNTKKFNDQFLVWVVSCLKFRSQLLPGTGPVNITQLSNSLLMILASSPAAQLNIFSICFIIILGWKCLMPW